MYALYLEDVIDLRDYSEFVVNNLFDIPMLRYIIEMRSD